MPGNRDRRAPETCFPIRQGADDETQLRNEGEFDPVSSTVTIGNVWSDEKPEVPESRLCWRGYSERMSGGSNAK